MLFTSVPCMFNFSSTFLFPFSLVIHFWISETATQLAVQFDKSVHKIYKTIFWGFQIGFHQLTREKLETVFLKMGISLSCQMNECNVLGCIANQYIAVYC